PNFGLYCRSSGVDLNSVSASDDMICASAAGVLRIKAVRTGLVVIEGIQSGLYLCMDAAGKLYGSPAVLDECYFLEKLEENHYNTYMSQKYKWYVGLKKNGRPKDGTKTHIGQKGIFFLPREVADH
uniref:Fibroblast growth factor n=1 Tax=Denticeps clupeoides TaxID=299321 RepID=A0AAY4EDJ9_9TELE